METAEPAALFGGTAAAPKPQRGPGKNGGHLVRGFFRGSSHLSQAQGRVGMAGIPQRGSGDEQLDHRDMKTCLNKTLKSLNTGTESPQAGAADNPFLGHGRAGRAPAPALAAREQAHISLFVDLPSFLGHHADPAATCQLGRRAGGTAAPGKSNPAGGRVPGKLEGAAGSALSHGEGRLCSGLPELSAACGQQRGCSSPWPTAQPDTPAAPSSQSQGKQHSSPRAPGERQTPAGAKFCRVAAFRAVPPREDAAIPYPAALPDSGTCAARLLTAPLCCWSKEPPQSCVPPQSSQACSSERPPQLPPALLCLHGARHLHEAQRGHRGPALPQGMFCPKLGLRAACRDRQQHSEGERGRGE